MRTKPNKMSRQVKSMIYGIERLIKLKRKNPHKKFGLSDDDLAIYDTEAWFKLHTKTKQKIK